MHHAGFGSQARGLYKLRAGFIFLTEELQDVTIFGMKFAIARITAYCLLQFAASFTQLRLRNENLTEAVMHFFLIRIEAQRDPVLFCCFIETNRFVQGKAVLPMGASAIG